MHEPAAARPSAGYLRVLTRLDATLLVIGCIIGSGVFFTPNDIAGHTQNTAVMLGVWVLGGGIALAGALTYAELGALYPRAGGVYVFLREAFGGLPAFLFGWTVLLVIAPGALAIVAGVFAQYLRAFVPLSERGVTLAALAVILGMTALNVRGVKHGSVLQSAATLGKLLALGLLIGAGLLYSGEPLPPTAPAVAPTKGLLAGFSAAMIPVLFSYGGWQNATFVAAEVEDPKRNVPLAMIAGTLVVVATYLLVNVSYLRLCSPAAIAESRTFSSLGAEVALGQGGGKVVTAGILVSMFGMSAAILLSNPRVAQAVGEDGLFFRWVGQLHARWRTPAPAIVVLGVWSSVLLLVGNVGQLFNSVVFADWTFFALSAASLFVFRRRGLERPYSCPLYPLVPGAFLVLATLMAVNAIAVSDGKSLALGVGVIAAGVPVYLVFLALRARRRRSAH